MRFGATTSEYAWPFLKKASCAPQNRSIARGSRRQQAAAGGSRRQQAAAVGSVGPINRFAADLQGFSHDVFCQIKSNLTSQFSDIISTSLVNFCFLISIVRLYTNEWTGNLSVILFAALLWMNWTVNHEHTRGVRGLAPPGKFEIQVIWKGWKGA